MDSVICLKGIPIPFHGYDEFSHFKSRLTYIDMNLYYHLIAHSSMAQFWLLFAVVCLKNFRNDIEVQYLKWK